MNWVYVSFLLGLIGVSLCVADFAAMTWKLPIIANGVNLVGGPLSSMGIAFVVASFLFDNKK